METTQCMTQSGILRLTWTFRCGHCAAGHIPWKKFISAPSRLGHWILNRPRRKSMASNGPFVPIASSEGAFGEVYDRGYQHYEGERLGRRHAFRALTTYSMKRALGAKKSWTAKMVPALMYVAAGLMVVIPLGIRAFFDEVSVVEYWEYFFSIFLILGVFVASVAPEMLCNDRSENVLSLYFARAITRMDYLFAKLLGTALLTLTITLLPMAIYWLGRQLLEDSPLSAMKDNAGDLWRVIVMSVVTALYL